MSQFRFKQFSVAQDRCAMKVSLDACLFGSFISLKAPYNILDIGTGTGLLSLMLAQRYQHKSGLNIDAIELDCAAYEQAKQNIHNSPFDAFIRVHQGAVQDFQSPEQYHNIICNPPFFTQHLKSQDSKRNLARHNDSLTLAELCQTIHRLLCPQGKAFLLLPIPELDSLYRQCEVAHLSVVKLVQIKAHTNKPAKLVIIEMEKTALSKIHHGETLMASSDSLVVYDEPQTYSPSFRRLLKDFYLKL